MAVPIPADVPFHLVTRVKAAAFDQTLSEAESHRRVVRPLASIQTEWPATDDVVDRCKRTRGLELQRGSQCVTSGQAQQATAIALNPFHASFASVRSGARTPAAPPSRGNWGR